MSFIRSSFLDFQSEKRQMNSNVQRFQSTPEPWTDSKAFKVFQEKDLLTRMSLKKLEDDQKRKEAERRNFLEIKASISRNSHVIGQSKDPISQNNSCFNGGELKHRITLQSSFKIQNPKQNDHFSHNESHPQESSMASPPNGHLVPGIQSGWDIRLKVEPMLQSKRREIVKMAHENQSSQQRRLNLAQSSVILKEEMPSSQPPGLPLNYSNPFFLKEYSRRHYI